MKVSWDDDYSQYMESHKIHVPNHQAVKWTSTYFYLPTVHLIPNLNSLISVCMVRISWAITFICEVEDQAKVLRFLH